MIPAQQGFQPDDATRIQLDLRLIQKLKFVAPGGAAQLIGKYNAFLDLMIEIGAVETEAVAAVLLGPIKREVGLDHHGLWAGNVRLVARNSGTARHVDCVAVDNKRHANEFSDFG